MFRSQALIRAGALALAVLNLFAVFYLGVRPWYLGWGARAEERARALPGDELVPAPRANTGSTRAITIHAPRSAVWPWLVQLGQDRAGFYSYELLEDLVGCEMPSSDRIRPEFQRRKLGDKLWMYPPHKAGGMGHALLARYEPEHLLAFATRQTGTTLDQPYDGLWNFVLEPMGAETTRLLVRGRAGGERGFWGQAFDRLVFEPIHFFMERRMMEEIKGLVEGHASSRASLMIQPIAWGFLLLLVLRSAVSVLRGRRWPLSLALFLISAAALEFLVFAQPAAWVSVAVTCYLWLSTFVPESGAASRSSTSPAQRLRARL
jgi:hypothetical protein